MQWLEEKCPCRGPNIGHQSVTIISKSFILNIPRSELCEFAPQASSFIPCHLFFFSMALPAHSGPRSLIQFHNHFSQTVVLLGRVISPSQGRYLHTAQHRHRINAHTPNFLALSGIRTHDPSVRASKDSSCLRPYTSKITCGILTDTSVIISAPLIVAVEWSAHLLHVQETGLRDFSPSSHVIG
jgi:hypothetical protein